uniref:Uncharacterized protein n=2 Tax=Coturnix japonica TaxID=93934 RepID=A0A8C2YER9_COTJA
MSTASSDGLGDYEKQQKELSRSYDSSVLDYSEDTWDPSSEEEVTSCQCESNSSELHCPIEDTECRAVLDPWESTLWLAGQSHAEELSEVVDSAAAERDFVGKCIGVLKNKEAGIKQERLVLDTHAEMTELSGEELDALQSFCIIKIRRVQQELISKQASGGKSRKQQHGFTSRASEASDLNCIVPNRLMNRIRLKNLQETFKQVTETQVHKSSLCPDCKKKKAELAKIAFLRQKKVLMERALLQEKLEEQIYSRDVLTLIGESLRSFPKLSEDPRNLWQKLKGKADSGALCLQQQQHDLCGERLGNEGECFLLSVRYQLLSSEG